MRRTVACTLALLLCCANATAGSGKVRYDATGISLLDFCVSIRFEATPTQMTRIRDVLQGGSDTLLDTTDGQFAFGRVQLINNDTDGGWNSEIWIFPDEGRANATLNGYGRMLSTHVNLFYGSNFQFKRAPENDYFTVAHEFMHLVWGIGDEYTSGSINDPNAVDAECELVPGANNSTYSLMDSYLTRGGNSFCAGVADPCNSSLCDNFTNNELCVESNHDLGDGDTAQQNYNGESCWETLANHAIWPATLPTGLPVDPAPANPPTVQFTELTPRDLERAVAICIDKSGSMSAEDLLPEGVPGSRLEFAVTAAQPFIRTLDTNDWAATIAFNQVAVPVQPLVQLTSPQIREDVANSFSGVTPGGPTGIGNAVIAGVNQIITRPDAAECSRAVIILTDGANTTGPEPTGPIVTDHVKNNGVALFTIVYGDEPESAGLVFLSESTGGAFYHVTTPDAIIDATTRLFNEYAGNATAASSGGFAPTGGTDATTVLMDPTATEARVQIAWTNPNNQLEVQVRLPNGELVRRANAGMPGIDLVETPISSQLIISDPVFIPGDWSIEVLGGVADADYTMLVACNSNDATLALGAGRPNPLPAEPVRILATPMFEGHGVIGDSVRVEATVTGPGLGINRGAALVLTDDGTTGDMAAADGTYSGFFTPPEMGVYTIDVNVLVGDGAVTQAGEFIFTDAPSASRPSVPFQRHARYQLVSGLDSIIYVDANAPPRQNGTSWANAMDDLQDALDRARSTPPGYIREIRVAQGTYTPDRSTGDRALSFELVNNVHLAGGYPGFDTADPNDRSLATGPTILSGDLNADDLPNFGNRTDNTNHVVTAGTISKRTRVEHLTISGGHAATILDRNGGAMFADGQCFVQMHDIIFRDNNANSGGGAVATQFGARPSFFGCDFIGNRATFSGGACQLGGSGPATIDACRFISNACGGAGGALMLISANPLITNSLFLGNQADVSGGAIRIRFSNGTRINSSTFVGNSTTDTGSTAGAINIDLGGQATANNIIAWGNTTAFGNTVQQQIDGAGTLIVNDSIVEGYSSGSLPGSGTNGNNPQFVDQLGPDNLPATGDENLRLTTGSPAVDTGSNAPTSGELDLDGNPRLVDGDADGTDTIDRGAYELPACAIVDIANPLGTVNVLDLLAYLDRWFSQDPDADLNASGDVDVLDLLAFLACWFTTSA